LVYATTSKALNGTDSGCYIAHGSIISELLLNKINITCYLDDRLGIEFKGSENKNFLGSGKIGDGGSLHDWLINAFYQYPITSRHTVNLDLISGTLQIT